jgi:phospholipid-binding lipoprotein MlaA
MSAHHRCAIVTAMILASCAHRPPDNPLDPLEPVNRAIWRFNTKADHYVLKPAAQGYVAVTTGWMREGVTNFFSNLFYPTTIANDLLQVKLLQGAADTSRFVINSIFGVGGLIDVGTRVGLQKHDEDFGQTLGYWGVGEGIFIMLPLLGPSDGRDLVGRGVDIFTTPTYYLPGRYDLPKYLVSYGLGTVNKRANLLPADSLMESQFDTYLFVRTAYLQHRESQIYDGTPPLQDLGIGDSNTNLVAPTGKEGPPK